MIDQDRLYAMIGEHLKSHREVRGLTQLQLAERVGLERTSITNIERGRQKLPLHVLFEICRTIGIAVSDVLPRMDQVEEQQDLMRVVIGTREMNLPASIAMLIDSSQ